MNSGSGGDSQSKKTLIFVERKEMADSIIEFLVSNGIDAKCIHSDREQRERDNAISDFKTGRCSILVATGVGAHGLDIKDVDHVINYDLPTNGIDEYIHRIGRTGRIGNHGRATSFYDPTVDRDIAQDLVKVLTDSQQDVPEWLLDEVNCSGRSRRTMNGSNCSHKRRSVDIEKSWID